MADLTYEQRIAKGEKAREVLEWLDENIAGDIKEDVWKTLTNGNTSNDTVDFVSSSARGWNLIRARLNHFVQDAAVAKNLMDKDKVGLKKPAAKRR
ncbi:MAG: hypothetical protein J5974_06500 [Pyramidobacter sp.]|nr:hypothetical protein [Pyramidobacter sp.]